METIIICMEIPNRIFLNPIIEEANEFTNKESAYTTAAPTITISKFGPSGSSKNKNIAREHRTDVIPKIINEVFFDLKFIVLLRQCEWNNDSSFCTLIFKNIERPV